MNVDTADATQTVNNTTKTVLANLEDLQDQNPYGPLADLEDDIDPQDGVSQTHSRNTTNERTPTQQDLEDAVSLLTAKFATTTLQPRDQDTPSTAAYLQQYLDDLDAYDAEPFLSQTVYALISPYRGKVYQERPDCLPEFKQCLQHLETPEDATALITRIDQWCLNAPSV